MSDIKKLIEFLDEEIAFYGEGIEPESDRHTQDFVHTLTEIKQVLEQVPLSDDELVEEMMQTIKKCFANVPHAWQDVSRETLVAEIRTLLQSRTEKPKITREVFLDFTSQLQHKFLTTDGVTGKKYFLIAAGLQLFCEKWLKSLGFDVEKKKEKP